MNEVYLPYLLAALNLVVGISIFCICVCRMAVSSKNVLGRVRLKYILMGPAGLATALNPVWGWFSSTYATSFLMIAVLIGLMSEAYQWGNGPPASVREDAMPREVRRGYLDSILHRLTSMFHSGGH